MALRSSSSNGMTELAGKELAGKEAEEAPAYPPCADPPPKYASGVGRMPPSKDPGRAAPGSAAFAPAEGVCPDAAAIRYWAFFWAIWFWRFDGRSPAWSSGPELI